MILKKLLLTVYLILQTLGFLLAQKQCTIKGEIVNRPQSKAILLLKAFDDPGSGSTIRIKIKNGKFSCQFSFTQEEAYSLVFEEEYHQGSIRKLNFFPVDGDVSMKLYNNSDFLKNQISGGEYNKEYFSFTKSIQIEYENSTKEIYNILDSLIDSGNYYSDTMKIVFTKINEADNQIIRNKLLHQKEEIEEDGLNLKPYAKKLNDSLLLFIKRHYNKQTEYASNNKSIVAYYILAKNLAHYQEDSSMFDLNVLEKEQKKFAEIYKDHPYTKYCNEILWNLKNIKIGGKLFDFTLEDISGKKHTLSKEIKGKYAFIDIWAPWCGPCIAKSRNMIPVYKEFCDNGFTIVGVAGKYKRLQDVEKLLKKDNYPWVTLIDRPEENNGINEKYGIKNAGGITMLVDNYGTIIAINPSINDVREILSLALIK
jgi:thiol-disulfide isomerase/thioredoxin